MLNSVYKKLCYIDLPYQGRQKYMHTFDLAAPVMAPGFEDYLEPVKGLCASAGATSGLAHMTVDEKVILAGMSQRRPRPHVDGCFMPQAQVWSHDDKGGGSRWFHGCNHIQSSEFKRMPVIVASSVPGCRVWRGVFDTEPKSDGDLSHLNLDEGEVLPANTGYLLSADCVHESMIHEKETQRTFLRIALPAAFKGI